MYGEGDDFVLIFNIIIFFSMWEIWKICNKVKYNQSQFLTLGKIFCQTTLLRLLEDWREALD